MSSFSPRVSKPYTEKQQTISCKHVWSPYDAQRFVYEVLQNHLLTNTPASLGYPGKKKYAKDSEKSDIKLTMAYSFKPEQPDKYPAIVVYRGAARYNQAQTFKGTIGTNTKEGDMYKTAAVTMPVTVVVIEKELAVVETFAEYVLHPFIYFNSQIQDEYNFKKFRVGSLSAPQPIAGAEQNMYMLELQLELEFNQTWKVSGDFLRLKTVEIVAES